MATLLLAFLSKVPFEYVTRIDEKPYPACMIHLYVDDVRVLLMSIPDAGLND